MCVIDIIRRVENSLDLVLMAVAGGGVVQPVGHCGTATDGAFSEEDERQDRLSGRP